LLITQITRLSLAVARLREAQGRTGQAAAARRATLTMRTAAGHWDSETAQFLAGRQPSAAARRLVDDASDVLGEPLVRAGRRLGLGCAGLGRGGHEDTSAGLPVCSSSSWWS